MGVNVGYLGVGEPLPKHAGFGQVDQVVDPPSLRSLADPDGEPERSAKSRGSGQGSLYRRQCKPDRPNAKDDAGLGLLGLVARIDERAVAAAEGEAIDADP